MLDVIITTSTCVEGTKDYVKLWDKMETTSSSRIAPIMDELDEAACVGLDRDGVVNYIELDTRHVKTFGLVLGVDKLNTGKTIKLYDTLTIDLTKPMVYLGEAESTIKTLEKKYNIEIDIQVKVKVGNEYYEEDKFNVHSKEVWDDVKQIHSFEISVYKRILNVTYRLVRAYYGYIKGSGWRKLIVDGIRTEV